MNIDKLRAKVRAQEKRLAQQADNNFALLQADRITEAYRIGTERIRRQWKCDDDYLAYLKSLEEKC